VEVEAAYYGAPPGWIGRSVQVQWDSRCVRLLDPRTGQLLREHLRQPRGRHRIKDEDRPPKTPLGTCNCWRAPTGPGRTSANSAAACIEHQAEAAVRRIQGVLSFWPKSTASRASTTPAPPPWNSALRLSLRAPLSGAAVPNCRLSLRQVDPLIRQLTLYRDLIIEQQNQSGEPTMNLIELQRAYDNSGSAAWPPCWKPAYARRKPNPWRRSI
jgi:hypothetical protein